MQAEFIHLNKAGSMNVDYANALVTRKPSCR